MNPYENCKINGPYLEKDNYFNVHIYWPNGVKKTTGWHRYIMEVNLGRILESNEQVHHIDGNPMNNDISNLQVLTVQDHGKHRRLEKEPKSFTCPWCSKEFWLDGEKLSQLRRNQRFNPHSKGPFCCRSCVTSYTNFKPPQSFVCPICDKKFELSGAKLTRHLSRKKVNPSKKDPFCSSECLRIARQTRAF